MSPEKKPKVKSIRVTEKWCKRCGICAEFCPGKVFTLEPGEAPVPARLEQCTACRLCEMRCPDWALSVEEVSGP